MSFRAVVLALDAPGSFNSRVGVHLHPLAGRPILWHVLEALRHAAPSEIVVLHHPDVSVDVAAAGAVRLVAGPPADASPDEVGRAIRAAVTAPGMTVLLDGCAALVQPATIARLLRAAEHGVAIVADADEHAAPVAVAGEGPALASAEDPRLPRSAARVVPSSPEETVRVADRHSLALAQRVVRDRLVRAHEAAGVSFLLPETVWLDVGVRIGPDTLVYPSVVIEGETEIGSECVIGPFTRLVEATIGRGVELRGWNYVSRAAVRNHAVLEPYVRRGID